MEKIFVKTSQSRLYTSDFRDINDLLEEGIWTVKSLTPIGQYGVNHPNSYGVIIVLTTEENI